MASGFDPMAAVLAGQSLPQANRPRPNLPIGQRGGVVQQRQQPQYFNDGAAAIQGISELVNTFVQQKQAQKQKADQEVQQGLAMAAAGMPVDKAKLAKTLKKSSMGEMLDFNNPANPNEYKAGAGFQMEQPGMGGQPQQQQMPGYTPPPAPQKPGFMGRVGEALGMRQPFVDPRSQGANVTDMMAQQAQQGGDLQRQMQALQMQSQIGDMQAKSSDNRMKLFQNQMMESFLSGTNPDGTPLAPDQRTKLESMLMSTGALKDIDPINAILRGAAGGGSGSVAGVPIRNILMGKVGLGGLVDREMSLMKSFLDDGADPKVARTAVDEIMTGKPVSVALPMSEQRRKERTANYKQFFDTYVPVTEEQRTMMQKALPVIGPAIERGNWQLVQEFIGGSIPTKESFDAAVKTKQISQADQQIAIGWKNAATAALSQQETARNNEANRQMRGTKMLMDVAEKTKDGKISQETGSAFAMGLASVIAGVKVTPGKTDETMWFDKPMEISSDFTSKPKDYTGQQPLPEPPSMGRSLAGAVIQGITPKIHADMRTGEVIKQPGYEPPAPTQADPVAEAKMRIAAAARMGVPPRAEDVAILQKAGK